MRLISLPGSSLLLAACGGGPAPEPAEPVFLNLGPEAGHVGGRFTRPITEACTACHNVLPGFVEGSENRFAHC